MNEGILYFPYINIPNNNWTIKSILYWDNVGIIVPDEFQWRPEKFEPYTVQLLETDLVEEMYVGQQLHQSCLKGIDTAFLDLILSPDFGIDVRREELEKGNYWVIYREKVSYFLHSQLIKLKLAKPNPNDHSTILVEMETSKILMFYLATTLSINRNFTPSTDDINNLSLSFAINDSQKEKIKLNNVRDKLLDDLIPYPINPDLTKLRRFKDKYHDDLRSFRILLEQYAYDISLFENEEVIQHKIDDKILEIKDKREKILSEFKGFNFKQLLYGSLLGICLSAESIANNHYFFAALSLAYNFIDQLGKYNNSIKSIRNKDFAYLALIDKKL